MRYPGTPGRRAFTTPRSPAGERATGPDVEAPPQRPDWIDRYDLERERAEEEAIQDERQPGGPLWDAEKGEPYDDATAARLINEARYPEQAEFRSEHYPVAAPDSACSAVTGDREPEAC
jgi:hypothetical protein